VAILGALLPIVLVLGVWIGGHPSWLPEPVREALVEDSTNTLDQGLEILERDYYRKVARSDLVNRSLGAAVRSLDDRFSHYFDPRDFRAFQRATEGEFSGVGMNVAQDRRGLRVLEVYSDSPAQKAGIRRGTLVVAVNGRSLAGKSTDASSALIQGKPGTAVRLTVVDGRRRESLRVTRARITVPVVQSRTLRAGGRKVAYVALSNFSDGAAAQLRHVVERRIAAGAQAIVLDLRGNGGGLLREAVGVASVFIPEGPIVSTKGRNRERKTYKASGTAINPKIPVAVVVNGSSASASEIVAGALQDRRRGRLVGSRTFGKGVFQEIEPLPNGGALDITVGEYFLPSGRNLGGGGVARGSGLDPDVRVADGRGADAALDAALRAVGDRRE